MKLPPSIIDKGIPALTALIAIAAVGAWVALTERGPNVLERSFELDAPRPVSPASAPTLTGTTFYNPAVPVTTSTESWPCFRGAARDDISQSTAQLAPTWPTSGPPRLWSVAAGQGYAGASVAGGRVYLLDYDEAAQCDSLRCFALESGREIWRRSYPVAIKPNHGISRTVPAVSGRYVVSLGPKCNVLCADAVNGAVIWRIDLVAEYGATVPDWYAGQCPLIDGGRAILAPGGSSLLIAVDLATGKPAWKTPNPHGWNMTHASVLPVTVAGTPMYVCCTTGGVVGVSAKDGTTLWENTGWTIPTAVVPTPVDVGGGRIFLSGGYGAGAMMLQVEQTDGKWTTRSLFRTPPQVFGSDQQTPIFYKGFLYGVIPGGQLVCLDLTGHQRWASGDAHRYGLGPYAIAGSRIYVLNDHGALDLVDAAPDAYHLRASAAILPGPEAWGPLAIAGNRLIARDLTHVVCLDIEKR
ncbi:MAG: PQQ-like beta-propeller repeat protein [Capsulimonadaceae bacterium]|nr:PQQ-like beta-propeller repeat protein [Capsulimonadaceae bacterium]